MGGGKEIGLPGEPSAWLDAGDCQVPSFHFRWSIYECLLC